MTDKQTADATSGAVKDPSDWVTGDEPATASQRSYLETLAAETDHELPEEVTKAQASELIDELRAESPRVPTE